MSRKFVYRVLRLSFLPACLAAIAVFAYSGQSEFSTLFGAVAVNTPRPGCTGPCTAGSVNVPECADDSLTVPPGPCNPAYCYLNELRYVTCTLGAPGPEQPQCVTGPNNPNDWWRQLTCRSQTCNINQGALTVWYNGVGNTCSWDGNGNNRATTPCQTPSCSTGPIVFIVTYAPRPTCPPPPAPPVPPASPGP